MKLRIPFLSLLFAISSTACAGFVDQAVETSTHAAPTWSQGVDVEAFWQQYADSKGGITWGKSSEYPEYDKVREGDTFWVEMSEGPCLMELFHSRWRRANDVRRWHPSVNDHGGCPYVFD